MKIIEEYQLKTYNQNLKDFTTKYQDAESFYKHVSKLENVSLQSFSFDRDMEFFGEASFITSVIISIMAHPHISNKREEVVIRAEQAQNLSVEAFQRVLKDSTLWKEKDLEMLPEYVYHYQHVDELRIYENQFIVLLIDLLDDELQKYSEFYVSMIPSFDSDKENKLDAKLTEQALTMIDGLKRKIRYLKNTYFYKEVSKGKRISKLIKPTNILTKDPKYRHCFKFYRKFVSYEDETTMLKDFRNYYFMNLLQVMEERGYKLVKNANNIIDNDNMKLSLETNQFNLDFSYIGEDLNLVVTSLENKNIKASHTLIFNETLKPELNDNLVKNKNTHTTEAISIWNLAYIEDDIYKLVHNPLTEKELISKWLDTKIDVVNGSMGLYARYCPVCKSHHIEISDNELEYQCMNCHSIYTFFEGKKENEIWFLRVRRA